MITPPTRRLSKLLNALHGSGMSRSSASTGPCSSPLVMSCSVNVTLLSSSSWALCLATSRCSLFMS